MKTKEMMNVIYDTLMKNTTHEQFDVSLVDECTIDNDDNTIVFNYGGFSYLLEITAI